MDIQRCGRNRQKRLETGGILVRPVNALGLDRKKGVYIRKRNGSRSLTSTLSCAALFLFYSSLPCSICFPSQLHIKNASTAGETARCVKTLTTKPHDLNSTLRICMTEEESQRPQCRLHSHVHTKQINEENVNTCISYAHYPPTITLPTW